MVGDKRLRPGSLQTEEDSHRLPVDNTLHRHSEQHLIGKVLAVGSDKLVEKLPAQLMEESDRVAPYKRCHTTNLNTFVCCIPHSNHSRFRIRVPTRYKLFRGQTSMKSTKTEYAREGKGDQ
jgi:hypothetical protein